MTQSIGERGDRAKSDAAALLAEAKAVRREAPNLWLMEFDPKDEIEGQTQAAFSAKWTMFDHKSSDADRLLTIQKKWYLEKYGYADEQAFASKLRRGSMILDAGTGNGAKAAWMAQLAPNALVVAVDFSTSIRAAAGAYAEVPNLIFLRADIAQLSCFRDNLFDYVNCDEVIHHTQNPEATFAELVRLLRPGGEFACYVYRRKALPRELLDEEFRRRCRDMSETELRQMAEQVTELGRLLSEIDGEREFPEIPALGISGGRMSVQRFIYWNFLKCYWNEAAGRANSVLINFDWYSPATAHRYDEAEFRAWATRQRLEEAHFHVEPACFCMRAVKRIGIVTAEPSSQDA